MAYYNGVISYLWNPGYQSISSKGRKRSEDDSNSFLRIPFKIVKGKWYHFQFRKEMAKWLAFNPQLSDKASTQAVFSDLAQYSFHYTVYNSFFLLWLQEGN